MDKVCSYKCFYSVNCQDFTESAVMFYSDEEDMLKANDASQVTTTGDV